MAGERLVQVENITYFEDRDSYLEWVAEWKEVWKRRSKEQRQLRITLSKPHDTLNRVWELQGKRASNKMYLRMLLYARRYAKRVAKAMKEELVAA